MIEEEQTAEAELEGGVNDGGKKNRGVIFGEGETLHGFIITYLC